MRKRISIKRKKKKAIRLLTCMRYLFLQIKVSLLNDLFFFFLLFILSFVTNNNFCCVVVGTTDIICNRIPNVAKCK